MSKIKKVGLLSLVAAGLMVVPVSAEAATKPHAFKNCTAMHAVYKHGVAKSTTTYKNEKKHGNGLKGAKPYISATWYAKNTKLDRDKDGVACEAP